MLMLMKCCVNYSKLAFNAFNVTGWRKEPKEPYKRNLR